MQTINPLVETLKAESLNEKVQARVSADAKNFLITKYGSEGEAIRHLTAKDMVATTEPQCIHRIHVIPEWLPDGLPRLLREQAVQGQFAIRLGVSDDGLLTGWELPAIASHFARGSHMALNGAELRVAL